MLRKALVLCLLAAALPASAQVYLGAEVGPDAFSRSAPEKPDNSGEDAFAWALSSEVSSTTLYAVFGSTEPEREMQKYLRAGVYRQQLAALLLLSEKTSVPFKELAAELPKAGGLRGLARTHKEDAMALFRKAGEMKAEADLRVPLFMVTSATAAAAPSTGTVRNE